MRKWDSNPKFEFKVWGKSDSNFATDPTNRRSVTGKVTYLEDAPVAIASKQQEGVTLSITEAELWAATSCAQDMLYVMHTIESLGLKVEKPMILQVDNKGAVDMANNWSSRGRTRHIEVREYFIRELKERNIILTEWISSQENEADTLTKNLPKKEFLGKNESYIGEN